MRYVLALLLASTAAYGDERLPIPNSDSSFSMFYRVVGVHEARTQTDVVHVYEIASSGKAGVELLLHLVADNRPPNMGKLSHIRVWKLGSKLDEVEKVTLTGTTVRIEGSIFPARRVTCTSVFAFEKGVLSDRLNDQGCKE